MQFGFRTLLFVMLLLGMLVLSYPLLFKPLNEQRDRAITETRQKQAKLASLDLATKTNDGLKGEIEKLRTAIAFLEGKLPKETEMDRVLQDVYKAAKDNNLNIRSVRNAKPIDGPTCSEQPIRMVVEGPFYPSFFKFLSTVEQLDRLTKIKEMKIDANPDKEDRSKAGNITADFVLTIYYESSQKVAVAQ
jgi:Tfp pilus assembly protein PilO